MIQPQSWSMERIEFNQTAPFTTQTIIRASERFYTAVDDYMF